MRDRSKTTYIWALKRIARNRETRNLVESGYNLVTNKKIWSHNE